MRSIFHAKHNLKAAAHQNSKGFTLIEVLIIAPIIVLMIGGFVGAIITITGEVMSTRNNNMLAYNLQDTLDRIESDVGVSTNFLPESDISPPTPLGYNNTTENFSNVSDTKGDMLILKTVLTDKNPLDSARQLVYLDDQPNDCTSADVNYNTIMTAVVVYFTKNNTLWRRTITPSNYATAGCSMPWQLPSCLPGIERGTFCKTDDIRLLDGVGVDDFHVSYFASANSTSADTIASDVEASVEDRRTALEGTTSVQISLTGNQTAAGRTINQTSTVMLTKINPPL